MKTADIFAVLRNSPHCVAIMRNGAKLRMHSEPVDDLLARLESRLSGLSDDEAERRLLRVGPNRLSAAKPVSSLKILGDQLRSVVVALLVGAAVISLLFGERIEALAICAVLAINTAIGFTTELRARRAMAALLQLDVPRAFVVRAGQLRAIDAHQLVPGDIIELNAGQSVPADGRIVEQADLRTDEAALTGESLPVSKHTATLSVTTPLADRTNMVYKGTTVVAGTARVVVTGTGADTELGRIGILVRQYQRGAHAARASSECSRPQARVAHSGRGVAHRDARCAPRRATGAGAGDLDCPSGGCGTRGTAGRGDHRPCRGRPAHGASSCPCSSSPSRRITGLDDRRLHRQDTNAHLGRHDGRSHLGRWNGSRASERSRSEPPPADTLRT